MEKYYAWADVVICRAGASTIAELSAVGKPAILVPLPTAADDHQRKNAMVMTEKKAAILLEQRELTASKLNEIMLNLQKNPEQLSQMAKNAKSMYKPQAAEAIAKIINDHLLGK
jgi:UDP-N-acetylglucosamine--N-acetylmuramyl-(pentapeptide) pyrophosphoryl-undecaprenol N-acetylglucosamine transferase